MNTNYELTIIDGSNLPLHLTNIISNHNNGAAKVDLDILECYCLAHKAIYPSLWKNIFVEYDTQLKIVTVHENERTLFSIKEKEVHELSETTSADLENLN